MGYSTNALVLVESSILGAVVKCQHKEGANPSWWEVHTEKGLFFFCFFFFALRRCDLLSWVGASNYIHWDGAKRPTCQLSIPFPTAERSCRRVRSRAVTSTHTCPLPAMVSTLKPSRCWPMEPVNHLTALHEGWSRIVLCITTTTWSPISDIHVSHVDQP